MSWTKDGVLTVLIPWCCVVTMIWKDDPELSQMFVNGPNENIDGGSCTLPDTMEAKLYRMMPVALDCTLYTTSTKVRTHTSPRGDIV